MLNCDCSSVLTSSMQDMGLCVTKSALMGPEPRPPSAGAFCEVTRTQGRRQGSVGASVEYSLSPSAI
eukprot:7110781-Pyramimonas_sp.AAC.1